MVRCPGAKKGPRPACQETHQRLEASGLDGTGRVPVPGQRGEDLDGRGKGLLGQVGVPLCHPEVGVPEEGLDAPDVDPAHREPGGEVVAQVVEAESRLNALASDAAVAPFLPVGDPAEGHADPRAVPPWREERRSGIGGGFQAPQDRVQVGIDWDVPNLPALGLAETHNSAPCAYPVDSARSGFNHTGMEHRFQGFGSPMTARRVGPCIRPRVALQATTHEQEGIWSELRCAERTG